MCPHTEASKSFPRHFAFQRLLFVLCLRVTIVVVHSLSLLSDLRSSYLSQEKSLHRSILDAELWCTGAWGVSQGVRPEGREGGIRGIIHTVTHSDTLTHCSRQYSCCFKKKDDS